MTVGMVPTMGALHAGHLSLIARAVEECDRVVATIFVNPRQFSSGEDFARYPRSLESDVAVLTRAGVHAVFAPSVEAMYPRDEVTTVCVGGSLGAVLEATARPGHLEGVALVVAKLFIAGRPDRAYFGQKDAQQCALVQRLARDLDTGVRVVVCPVVRDTDGLALSSRNAYLDPDERRRALAIPAGLTAAVEQFAGGERRSARLKAAVVCELDRMAVAVDYVAVVDPSTFNEVEIAAPGCQILVAAKIGDTRLIDVVRMGIDGPPLVRSAGKKACSGSS
jgi:pantoate--beta-alanine ligase